MSVQTHSIRHAWLTKDDMPGSIVCCRAFFPIAYKDAFYGALALLVESDNWQKDGSTDVETVASAFLEAYQLTISGGVCMPPGSVIEFAGTVLPDGYLWCDGAEYDKGDYPSLFDAIGQTWGGTGDNFAVPDMRSAFKLGASASYPLASAGGVESVTLTIDQIPSHRHALGPGVRLSVVPYGEIPSAGPEIDMNGQTGLTGGGQSHTNMPPYVALNAIIKT